MNTAPIGVFDSGMGGLSVLSALRAALPSEHFVYYGDNAHALEFVTRIRAALKAENISTAPLGDVISAR